LRSTTLSDGGLQPLKLPARSPNLNAFAERWVRSIKQECLSKLILFSETSLTRVLAEYLAHYHTERNHQGKRNLLLFPAPVDTSPPGKPILCKQRLGGLLKYYVRAA
jgi:putative transposase